MNTMIAKRRLEWLGHVAIVHEHCMPKMSFVVGYHLTTRRATKKVERRHPQGLTGTCCLRRTVVEGNPVQRMEHHVPKVAEPAGACRAISTATPGEMPHLQQILSEGI